VDPVAALQGARLSASQLGNAKLIVRQFMLAGYPAGIALAAVVNAKAESNLDARAVAGEPKGGYSVGLFQLYDRGAGKGMAVSPGKPPPSHDPRFDPRRNTARIIQEVRSPYGKQLLAAYQQGASVAQLAGIFARDIERPANAAVRAKEREDLTRRMFGSLADMPANRLGAGPGVGSVAQAVVLAPALVPWWVWLIPAGVIGLSLTGAILFGGGRRTRRL